MEENQNPQVDTPVSPPATPISVPPAVIDSPTEKPYAKVVIRYAAGIIDNLIVSLISAPFWLLTFLIKDSPARLVSVFLLFLQFGYYVYLIHKYQATWGKKFFKLIVEPIDGKEMTVGKAVLREVVGKFLSGIVLGLGFLWAVFDKRKQAWHDKLAHTVVIQNEPLSKGRKIVAYVIAFIIPIAILGILAVAILVSVNPATQVERARDAQERYRQLNENTRQQVDEIHSIYETPEETPAYIY